MRRPLPIIARGNRRKVKRPAKVLLACPRLASDWEFAALTALMKPKLENRLGWRAGDQKWPAAGDATVAEVCSRIGERLEMAPKVTLHAEGDYHLVAEIRAEQFEEAKALVLLLSRRLPALWFRLGPLCVREGRFYRRERGYKLRLVAARDVHLKRDIRMALRGLL